MNFAHDSARYADNFEQKFRKYVHEVSFIGRLTMHLAVAGTGGFVGFTTSKILRHSCHGSFIEHHRKVVERSEQLEGENTVGAHAFRAGRAECS